MRQICKQPKRFWATKFLLTCTLAGALSGCARELSTRELVLENRKDPDSHAIYDKLVAGGKKHVGELKKILLDSDNEDDHILVLAVLQEVDPNESSPAVAEFIRRVRRGPNIDSIGTALRFFGETDPSIARRYLREFAEPPPKWTVNQRDTYRDAWNYAAKKIGEVQLPNLIR